MSFKSLTEPATQDYIGLCFYSFSCDLFQVKIPLNYLMLP